MRKSHGTGSRGHTSVVKASYPDGKGRENRLSYWCWWFEGLGKMWTIYIDIYCIYIYCSCWETSKLSRNKALSSEHITNHCKQTGHWELVNVGSESEVNEQKTYQCQYLRHIMKGWHAFSLHSLYISRVLVMDAMLLYAAIKLTYHHHHHQHHHHHHHHHLRHHNMSEQSMSLDCFDYGSEITIWLEHVTKLKSMIPHNSRYVVGPRLKFRIQHP